MLLAPTFVTGLSGARLRHESKTRARQVILRHIAPHLFTLAFVDSMLDLLGKYELVDAWPVDYLLAYLKQMYNREFGLPNGQARLISLDELSKFVRYLPRCDLAVTDTSSQSSKGKAHRATKAAAEQSVDSEDPYVYFTQEEVATLWKEVTCARFLCCSLRDAVAVATRSFARTQTS